MSSVKHKQRISQRKVPNKGKAKFASLQDNATCKATKVLYRFLHERRHLLNAVIAV